MWQLAETHQDLHGEQPFPGVASVNGELNRQTCRHAFGVQAGAARTHFAGVMPRLRDYLEWAVEEGENVKCD